MAQISYEHIADEFLQTWFYSTYAAKPFCVSVSRLSKTCEPVRAILSSRHEISISLYSGIGILKREM